MTSGLSLEADLNSFSGIGKHAVNEVLGGATSIALSKSLGQDASFHGLLESSLINTLAAAGFNQVGNAGDRYNLKPGDAEMVAMHALMGGLVAKAQGGEFATGAMAAGVNEAVVADMDKLFQGLDEETRKNLLLGASQLVGLLAAAAQDPGGDGSHLNVGANVAKASTQYNHELHRKNADSFAQAVLDACAERPQSCAVEPGSVTQDELMQALEAMAAHGEGVDDLNPDAIKLVNQYYQDERYRDTLENDLFYPTESEEFRIKAEQVAELAMAGAGLASAAKGAGGGLFSWVKGLFGTKGAGTPGKVKIEPGAIPDSNEVRAGQGLSELGYDVTHQTTASAKGIQGQRTADLHVDGVGSIDVYTPQNISPSNIVRAIEKKSNQAGGVLVQADLSDVEMSSIAARTWGKTNAQNIKTIFFQKLDGLVIRFDRPSGGG